MERTAYPETFTTVPPPSGERKPGHLSDAQIRQYFKDGYLNVETFFAPEELQPCRDAIEKMVDDLAVKLQNAGKIKDLYRDYGLFRRLARMEQDYPDVPILMFKHQKLSKEFKDLWSNERLLNVIEQLIGPEVAGYPVWNLRAKTPSNIYGVVPWHQDSAYFSPESYDHLIPIAWIPFLDATKENGCMEMIKGGHTRGLVAEHQCCVGDTWFVNLEEDEMANTLGINVKEDIKVEPVKYGGFLLFNNLTPHRSLPNISPDVRWSVDFRWQSPFENWGFYDIVEGITFRSANVPNLTADWDKFTSVDRKAIWNERYNRNSGEQDEFDTTVTGPWFGRWKVINHNRHFDAFKPYIN